MSEGALTENDVRELLKIKTESKNLDYKQNMNWDTLSRDDKTKIAKDILAMSNTQDGGKIVFGVRDADFELIGLTLEEFSSFDQTRINDFLHQYTDPKFSCQVYKYEIDGYKIVVIDVPEFNEVPILCRKDAHLTSDSSKQILKQGQMYIRTEKGTSEAISTSDDMREILGRATIKKGDQLLRSIELLLKGKPLKDSDDLKKYYQNEIEEGEKFLVSKLGDELDKHGYWEVYAYPNEYIENRIEEISQAKELVLRSKVSLRGWSFPHTQNNAEHGLASNFGKGHQSFTKWDRYREGYRIYQSGLFMWKRVLWEDIEGYKNNGRNVLSFISFIWSVTEFMIFFKRLYEQIASNENIIIRIVLNGCNDRELVSFDPSVDIREGHICREDAPIVTEKNVNVVELKAAYKEIAADIIKRIFSIFNWDDISEETIDQWQMKLIERRY